MDSNSKLRQSAKSAFTTAASLAASAMLARTLINDFLPSEVYNYFSEATNALFSRLSTQHTIVIKEIEGYNTNEIYEAVEAYLATKVSTSMRRLRASKVAGEQKTITISLEEGEEMIDNFQGAQIKWQLFCQEYSNNQEYEDRPIEKRTFELTFHLKYKDTILSSYLPYILDRAQAMKAQDRALSLYMNSGDYWTPIKLQHPATFDTLAMDTELKQAVIDDLARFVKRKDYYKRIGKAWKRGYLLYGPPGTGKSSMVAAMANYLKFDIYNLELAEVGCNKSLQRLLVGMASKSVLVVEDIDCSIELKNREVENKAQDGQSQITLSGILNCIDGLWSCCGDERIIVFTTNYKDRLDPALTRPGRMDMHIHMGYCGFSGFRMLASNYHGIDDHLLYGEVEDLIKDAEVTPAELAEQLMRSDDIEIALRGVIEFLQKKKMGNNSER